MSHQATTVASDNTGRCDRYWHGAGRVCVSPPLVLPGTPGIAEIGAFIREELVRKHDDWLGVKGRQGVESDGFDLCLDQGLR